MSIIDENLQETSEQSQPLFSAILTPYRSLSPKGFLILLSIFGAVSFIIGVVFFVNGAWPVVGFLGLDVFLVYLAFRMNYRAGKVYETVDLIGDELVVSRVSPSGKELYWRFNPYWVKVLVELQSNESVKLVLYSHEQTLEFGRFLLDEEKIQFAQALKDALFEYRGGVRV
ncbi:MAG: DUF2244 domain-containing protein [Methyloligellaceae bacterium]